MRNSISFILLAFLSIFLFEACKVGPNFKASRDEIDSAAVYRFDSLQLAMQDSVLNLKWWELFDDPVLEELIDIGMRENKNILIASSRIEQARAQLGFTKADMWPSFQYNLGAQRGNILAGQPTNETLDATNFFTGFGTLNWELDFWGKFRRSNEAARAEMVATEYGQRTIQIGLIASIVGTYYQLLDFRWREYISRKTLELRQESLNIIQARYDKGIVPEIDLNQAQIQRAIAAAAVPFYQRRVGITENALAFFWAEVPERLV